MAETTASFRDKHPSTEMIAGVSGPAPKWSGADSMWTISLFGTAVGAGILFLPISAGAGGLWPLLVATLLIGPMAYLSHRGLSRMVCASPKPDRNITEVAEDYFGTVPGRIITVLYFCSILPIVLIYGVGITNTVDDLMVSQLDMDPLPRPLLAAICVGVMSIAVVFGQKIMLVVTQWVVYPLILVLAAVTVYLIPRWDFSNLQQEGGTSFGQFLMSLWLVIPVLVFAFNHAAAISQFSKNMRERYGSYAPVKASSILRVTNIALVIFTMGFVWSCVLTVGPDGLAEARELNVPILSYLASAVDAPIIGWLGPIVAITAITSSYFGHWMGAHEGAMSIVRQNVDPHHRRLGDRALNAGVICVLIFCTWLAGVLNPSILDLIEAMVGPIMAVILYLMPMYAIHTVPALKPYRGRLSNIFVTVMGFVAVGAVVLTLIK